MRLPSALLLVIALSGALLRPAQALIFQEYVDQQGHHFLVARDCRNFSTDLEPWKSFDAQHGCRGGAEKEGFTAASSGYAGDGATLDYILSLSEGKGGTLFNFMAVAGGVASDAGTAQTVAEQQRHPHAFSEVWLNSGGGDVDAGVEMARVLRRHGMTVRVPSNYQCISACTIAFMGGVIRVMDENAAFRVHSASSVEAAPSRKFVEALRKDPNTAMEDYAREQQVSARYMALRLATLFQNTLRVPLRVAQLPESDDAFCAWAGGRWVANRFCSTEGEQAPTAATHFSYLDRDSPERLADIARLRREGPSAVQDILMRLERESMALAIADLEATAEQRGPRARPALAMLRAMWMTSITDTSYLSPNQMITMGYTTPILNSANQ